MTRSNLAYKTNLDYKEKYKEHFEKPSHIGRIKKKHIKNVKPAFYISLIVFASFILSFYISTLAKGAVITFKINEKKKQLEIEQSETVRLNSILESKHSNYSDIEKYAKLNLNMKNKTINQVYYISRPKNNKFEKTKNKTEKFKKSGKFIDKLKNCINSLFG